MPNYRLPLLLLVLSLLSACGRKVETFDFQQQLAYFPLERPGQTWHYVVDSIVYNEYLLSRDSLRFELLERVVGTEEDAAGNLYHRIERYRRDQPSQAWQLLEVWPALIRGRQAERIEDNMRQIKLVFPLYLNQAWDGLVHIRKDTLFEIPGGNIAVFKDWAQFQILELDQVYRDWDSVLLVQRVDRSNLIERRFSTERYAKGIGLVERRDSILDTQCGGDLANCIGQTWAEKAEKGYILHQTLVAYTPQ